MLTSTAAASTDPGLLRARSKFERYETPSGHVYPRIRTFYNQHTNAEKLPADLPLIVLQHGLGGSVAQFAPLLNSLTQIAPCLAIDLPGCGLSAFRPDEIEAYTTTAFAELLYVAIDRYRNKETNQKVILIGHSMGCSITALLASSSSPLHHLCSDVIISLVAICPRSRTMSEHELRGIARLGYLPSVVFDLMRMYDRIGGQESASVLRVIGKGADTETKKLQLRFNQQSKSAVFQRYIAAAAMQETTATQDGEDSILGKRTWAAIKVPLMLVAAEDDKLAPVEEAVRIKKWLKPDRHDSVATDPASGVIEAAEPQRDDLEIPSLLAKASDVSVATEPTTQTETSHISHTPSHASAAEIQQEETTTVHGSYLKTTIFPSPTSHGLLYSNSDVRILSRRIETFLATYADARVAPGWQLRHMTTSGKWDVKNLKKWQAVAPCSEPIGGVFRAMKTMREIDEVHSPPEFAKKYGWKVIPDGVAAVVDISLDVPVYDKKGLEAAGIEYYKLPIVSKQPPSADEVEQFIALIDSLRESIKLKSSSGDGIHPTIGVHCHYGFNRTGANIVCYLVERLNWKLQDALDEFAQKRPPGIKHDYFVNELYVRYLGRKER